MNQQVLDKFWEILNLTEDFLSDGYKKKHSPSPRVKVSLAGKKISSGDSLAGLQRQVASCNKCHLHQTRRQTVFGVGSQSPEVVVVGDFPDGYDQMQGLPFQGGVGDYLDKWLKAICLDRQVNAWLCNLIKCPPPEGHTPDRQEQRSCYPYLERQIALLKPKAIFCCGEIPARMLTGEISTPLENLRGKSWKYCGIPLIVTYHPRLVLQNQQSLRPLVWQDLQLLKDQINV